MLDKPLSIQNQVQNLKGRGLSFKNEKSAKAFFLNHNYYRFKGYALHYHDKSLNKSFFDKTFFEDLLDIYNFDREFRTLVFGAIGQIEIILRSQIIYRYSIEYGELWYSDSTHFKRDNVHSNFIRKLQEEISKSKEEFIIHNRAKNQNSDFECWKSLEILSFGELSKMFQNLSADSCKMDIVTHFDAKSASILINWIHCLSIIRNICAHHGRLWDRTLKNIILPDNLPSAFIQNRSIQNDRVYSSLCCLLYLLNSVDPSNNFKFQFIELLNKYPSVPLDKMGFPKGWETDPYWSC